MSAPRGAQQPSHVPVLANPEDRGDRPLSQVLESALSQLAGASDMCRCMALVIASKRRPTTPSMPPRTTAGLRGSTHRSVECL